MVGFFTIVAHFWYHLSVSLFSVAVIKCPDVDNLREKESVVSEEQNPS